jgi:Repeat of unknown function (DUF5648)
MSDNITNPDRRAMRTMQLIPFSIVTITLGLASGCIGDIAPIDDSMPHNESSETSALTGRINVHRSANYSTGEHFYVTNPNEAVAAGFTIETLNYYGLGTSFVQNSVPFYRCYWQGAGKHLYTVQANCEIADARNEGQLGFIATIQQAGTVPLYRLYLPGNNDHFYTISNSERMLAILNVGYRDEGISGYVFPTASP